MQTPIWKIAATIGGGLLTGVAIWLNAEHVASAEGWKSPLVFAGIIVTLCAAFAPPFAERAAKSGQFLKSAMLWTFFGLAVCFSLSASISRSSSYASGKVETVEQANDAREIAKQELADMIEQRDAECKTGVGPNCRELRDLVVTAREKLAGTAPAKAADPGSDRLSAVLGVDRGQVQLYVPLLLPLGLELGGFIFLAAGLAPARRHREIATEPAAKPAQTTAKRSLAVAKLMREASQSAKPVANRKYYLGRLEREFPAIAKRVHKGEISVYRACIEAGLRKAPKSSAKWTKVDAYAAADKITV